MQDRLGRHAPHNLTDAEARYIIFKRKRETWLGPEDPDDREWLDRPLTLFGQALIACGFLALALVALAVIRWWVLR